MHLKTAILFFSRSAELESQLKRLHQSNRRNSLIVREMYDHSLAVLQSSELPVICFDEQRQTGTSFGEKLTNSVQHVFESGYEEVIIVGNDCPQLELADIQKASVGFQNGLNSIGLTQAGGVYLIALEKSKFDADAFANLPWQANQLAQSLETYLSKTTNYQTLETKREVNNAVHLQALSFLVPFNKFIAQLLALINAIFISIVSQKHILRTAYYSTPAHRGPPIV